MSEADLELPQRARERLTSLRYVGEFTEEQADERGCMLIATEHGQDSTAEQIKIAWLVDSDGFVRHARFRSLATGIDLLAYDIMAELCIGVTVNMAGGVTPGHVRRQLRLVYGVPDGLLPWGEDDPAFPVLVKALNRHKGLAQDATDEAADTTDSVGGAKLLSAADWHEIGLFEKVRRIEGVLDEHVRPMLASDGGGIELVDLNDDRLVVQYEGACGSCSSSIGGTMVFIEDTLADHLGVELKLDVQGMDGMDAEMMGL